MDITYGTVPPAENTVYRLAGVSKIYRKGGREILAVRDLDLDIKTGEWLAVQGKTGHGKTTVLLADEPTGNLDEDTRDEIIALLDTLWRERGLTLILVTHDSAIARRAQRIGVMSRGRLSIREDTRA